MIDFSAAYAGLKFAKDALQYTLDQKVDQKVQDKIGEALEKIGKVQDDLFMVREDLLRLQEENHRLKEELKEKESWESKMGGYHLIKTEASAMIYESTSEPIHYVCPSCTQKKEIHILQGSSKKQINLFCPSCKTTYKFRENEQSVRVSRSFF